MLARFYALGEAATPPSLIIKVEIRGGKSIHIVYFCTVKSIKTCIKNASMKVKVLFAHVTKVKGRNWRLWNVLM